MRVCGNLVVQFYHIAGHNSCKCVVVHSAGTNLIQIGNDECGQMTLAVHNDRLLDVGKGVQNHLNLLGENVLTVCRQQHVLAASGQEYGSILVYRAHIAGTEPAVLVQNLGSSLRILVVTLEYAVTLYDNLTGNVFGISRVNAALNAFSNDFTYRLHLVLAFLTDSDCGAGFGHTVTGHEWNLQLLGHQVLQIERHSSTAGNQQLNVLTECRHENGTQGYAVVQVVLVISQLLLARFAAYELADGVVQHLDQDERNGKEHVGHIARYGSGHSESIVTADEAAAARFRAEVDAACVYVNAPTSFTDGAQFGLGAEIGISTQKLGARGPMGLAEITTYKWLIDGNGQVRP